jgi:hypothetical protein
MSDGMAPDRSEQQELKLKTQPRRLTGDQDFDEILEECFNILGVKGDDYTIGTHDRLHNFKTVSGFTGMTPPAVLGVYFYKHVAAIFAYIKSNGKKQSEPISGRIADCINYMLLFYKMVKEIERGNIKF